MALFTEISMDDYAKINARNQRNAAEKAAQRLQQKQAGLEAAQNKKTKTSLESALSGLVSGIGERIGDIGSTLNNIGKTVVGGINQIGKNKAIENTTKQDSERRNAIAKKYGFNSYSEAANSDKVGEDFWNEIKGSNEQTKKEQKKVTDNYRKTGKYGDVTNVNTNTAKGQALNTIDSVLGVIPGVGGVVANVGGGAISGIGDEYKRAGRDGGSFNLENALKNAAVGGASGLAGSAGAAGLSKVANKYGGNAVGKALGSNLASGISGGASAGAIGGAIGTALNGGSLEDSLAAALEGAKAGGIGGGAMAGAMGLGGTTLDKIRNRGTTAQAIEPLDAETVQKNRIEAPTAERIPSTVEAVEPTNNRRGIAIKDYNAGVENIPVRVANGAEPVPGRGKYIDSVVRRSDANLPEAQRPIVEQAPIYYHGSPETNLTEFDLSKAGKNTMSGEKAIFFTDSAPTAEEFAYERIPTDSIFFNNKGKKGKVYRTNLDIKNTLDLDNLTDAQIAELWDYASPLGQLNGRDGFIKQMKYWRDEAKNPQLIKGNLDLGALAKSDYDSFSATMYPNSDNTAKEYGIFDPTKATILQDGNSGKTLQDALTKIDVQNTPSIEDIIQVNRTQPQTVEPRYTESIIPARQYEQTVKNMPEAEITTPKTVSTAPEQRITTPEPELDYNTQIQRQKAQIQADKLKRQAIGGVLDQYSTTRLNDHINGLPEAVEDMLKLGFTDRAEIDYYANKMTGKDGELSKVIRNSLKNAEPVKMETGTTWEKIYEAAGADKTAQKEIKSFVDSQAGKYQKDADGTWNRQDLYDFGKDLETKGYKLKDRYERLGNEKDRACSNAYIDLSERIIDNATNGVEVSGNINLKKLISIAPDNAEHISRMQDLAQNAKTVDDIRHAMANTTKMALLKKAEDFNINTYGQNQGDFGKNANRVIKGVKAMNSYNPAIAVAQAGIEMASESPKIKQRNIGKNYEKAQKLQAQANGEAPINSGKFAGIKEKLSNIKDANIAQGAKNLAGKAAGIANNATANLNNESLANFSRAGMNTLGNQAQQFANKQMGKAEAERSQDRIENARTLANAQNEYANALADYNTQEANYNAQMAQQQASSMGSQLDRISAAMELALNAGDITAYGQLADLYKQAAEIEELMNPTAKTEAKALSTSQSKALTAQQQLDALSQMTPDAGTVASGIPLLGNIVNLTGGNEYANQASSLATTLGYLLSGANIKESEAKAIGQAYVPNAFDSEAVRQQKLERARQLIQSYMADTGALEA